MVVDVIVAAPLTITLPVTSKEPVNLCLSSILSPKEVEPLAIATDIEVTEDVTTKFSAIISPFTTQSVLTSALPSSLCLISNDDSPICNADEAVTALKVTVLVVPTSCPILNVNVFVD